MKLYSDIQRRQGRKPLLAPDPAGETRWNGCIDETKRANQIMGDLCEANNSLLAPTGDNFSMVKESERESNDLSRLTYTLEDKMILRQFEGAAAPAKVLLPISPGQEIHMELCTLHTLSYLEADQE